MECYKLKFLLMISNFILLFLVIVKKNTYIQMGK
jgi:hypothetical protein